MTERPPVLHDDRYAKLDHTHPDAGGTATLPTTTKGDLIVHDGSTNVREGVGTDTHVLTADSTTSTGIKWAAAPGASSGANTADAFVTIGHPADLTAERNLAVGAGLTLTDGGANGDVTISLTGGTPPSTGDAFVTIGHPAGLTAERNLAVGSPITLVDGGANGDVTIDFDETVAIGNNARVMVRKNAGADVGPRRRLNFIEDNGITITTTDDAGDEEVEIRFAVIDPPTGSYAPGSYTIPTAKFRLAAKRQEFKGTDRLTVQGTGRLSLHN